MSTEEAEINAIKALAFIASEENIISQFISQTGLFPNQLIENTQNPEWLGAVLDFLMEDETLLLRFCELEKLQPEKITMLRSHLPGGINTHWT